MSEEKTQTMSEMVEDLKKAGTKYCDGREMAECAMVEIEGIIEKFRTLEPDERKVLQSLGEVEYFINEKLRSKRKEK